MDYGAFFHAERFDPEAVKALYEPDHQGGIVIPRFLTNRFQEALSWQAKNMSSEEGHVLCDPSEYRGVNHFFTLADRFAMFLDEYMGGFFSQLLFDTSDLWYAPKGEESALPHQTPGHRNISALWILQGVAPLYLGNGTDSRKRFLTSRRDVMLMREPREEGGARTSILL